MIRLNSIKIINNGFVDELCGDNRINVLKAKLKNKAAKLLRINPSQISEVIIRKHSIDARKKPEIFDVFVVDILLEKRISEEAVIKKSGCKTAALVSEKKYRFPNNRKEDEELKRDHGMTPRRPIIIGSGPAGLFCAYELAKAGYCPIVLERGMDIDKRHDAVSAFWKGGELMPKGNVQFGEGGAGTFSDGKLNTMVKDKKGLGYECLNIFYEFGADEDILYESKPHIGTDVLRKVIKNIRNEIIRLGGSFYFETKVTELIVSDGSIKGVKCEDGKTFSSDVVVLAIGHSARDTFYALKDQGLDMEPKAFAVGLRVEHPQALINKSQYGIENPKSLPPSPYKVTARSSDGRGVYSFCMCPGGYVVNASSEDNRLCVNGMSYSGRDGKNANSAIVVSVEPKDFGGSDVLSGVEFQRRLEEKAYEVGDGKVPVEYFDDFKSAVLKEPVKSKKKENRNTPCIKGLWQFAPVHEILPDDINNSIVQGMEQFGRMIKGFDNDEVIFSGVEARTSSPVRINRDDELEAIGIKGLYPCGEGAGYAGGITSAAMDGIRVAEQIAIHYRSPKAFYRKLMLEKRDLISEAEREQLSEKIAENLFSSIEYQKSDKLLIYCSMGSEASTDGIINRALEDKKEVFCPVVTDTKNRVMKFVKIESKRELKPGKFGILEPVIDPSSKIYEGGNGNTLLILPGLIFDKTGNRIGYGGGFYDRFMEDFKKELLDDTIKSVAIGFDLQIISEDLSEYMNGMDRKVSSIITDKGRRDYD
ncbi:5-formyltetrahydrofolate cyclo-ligase [Butyrivibrio sp. VCD2006]|uniref:5-formyltetrahydrofolate cyclo-ligase n=1 Tax=Butyrivibrio sp. VCD2006 TaxID=1280664 RepID=UPI00041B0346|nr:5-formyltetrahydrofolate cyclo-ligase [Butyrivibrio sp. VCD2006]